MPKKVVGERVYLSPMCVEDAPQYYQWMNDSQITDGLGGSSRVISLDSERKWIEDNAQEPQFAIVRLEDDLLLGNGGLQNINQLHRSAEVGLFIGDETHRSQGYGGEALRLILRFGFKFMNLHNIMLRVFSFNERAIHAYRSVGFRETGRRSECYFLNGTWHDELFMEILEREFKD